MLIDFRAIPEEFVRIFDETAFVEAIYGKCSIVGPSTALASLRSLARNVSFGFQTLFRKKADNVRRGIRSVR